MIFIIIVDVLLHFCRCVEHCPENNVIATGGWDETVKLWDPRNKSSVGSYSQPGKVCIKKVVFVTAAKKIFFCERFIPCLFVATA